MEEQTSDCRYDKILRVNIGKTNFRAIISPGEDYELLVDRVKEVLTCNCIDTRRLVSLVDDKNTQITKELWVLEMHKTGTVKVILSDHPLPFLILIVVGSLVWSFIATLIISQIFQFSLLKLFALFLLIVFVIASLLAIVLFRYIHKQQKVGAALLYPVS